MSFSYSGNPSTSQLDAARFAIMDTNPSAPIMSDEEILYLIEKSQGNEDTLMYNLYLQCANKLALVPTRTLGPESENHRSQYEFYLNRLKYYQRKNAGGFSWPNYTYPKVFKKGMMHNPPLPNYPEVYNHTSRVVAEGTEENTEPASPPPVIDPAVPGNPNDPANIPSVEAIAATTLQLREAEPIELNTPQNVFPSVAPWINNKFEILPFVRMTGTGDVVYGNPVPALCYPVPATEEDRTFYGENVTFKTKLYVDGGLIINVKDRVVFGNEKHTIKKILEYYDGNTGRVSIKVVLI